MNDIFDNGRRSTTEVILLLGMTHRPAAKGRVAWSRDIIKDGVVVFTGPVEEANAFLRRVWDEKQQGRR